MTLAIQPDCYSEKHSPNCDCGKWRDKFAIQLAPLMRGDDSAFTIYEAADLLCTERAARYRKEGFFDGRRPPQEGPPPGATHWTVEVGEEKPLAIYLRHSGYPCVNCESGDRAYEPLGQEGGGDPYCVKCSVAAGFSFPLPLPCPYPSYAK